MINRLVAAPLTAALLLSASGCSWFDKKEEPPLPGKRISVLQLDNAPKPDERLAHAPVTLPEPVANSAWPMDEKLGDHNTGNAALAEHPALVWQVPLVQGNTDTLRLLAPPVIADGHIYTMDAAYNVNAFSAADGTALWHVNVVPPEQTGETVGGGLAYGGGRLVAATGFAEVWALDPANGGMIWRSHVPSPIHTTPSVMNQRVFVVTVDNQTLALSLHDGATQWTHTGILENASILGGSGPTADKSVVISPYSSGELAALRLENGRVAWSDSLAAVRRIGALIQLADIHAAPIIDHGTVFAVSHSGRTVAIDERSGSRMWEQDIGGTETPNIAGDYLFMISNNNELIALTRQAGRVRWVTQLDKYLDPEKKKYPAVWHGPVLAGGQLYLAGNNGELLTVSPANGEIVSTVTLPSPAAMAPIVANSTLYVVTDSGLLMAYR